MVTYIFKLFFLMMKFSWLLINSDFKVCVVVLIFIFLVSKFSFLVLKGKFFYMLKLWLMIIFVMLLFSVFLLGLISISVGSFMNLK